jgi:hypothetical protein
MLAINAAFIVSLVTVSLLNVPAYIQPSSVFTSPFSSLGLTTLIINYGYIISSIISFTLWWIATVMILRSYRNKSGKISWLALGLPLVYFLIQFQPVFLSVFSSLIASEPVLFSTIYTLVFTLSKPVGGILFGITFWVITRKLDNEVSRSYLIISAYGLPCIRFKPGGCLSFRS